jgi:HEPN domain-containing protein
VHSEPLTLQIRLMSGEATKRLTDAALLSSSPSSHSNSAYLLTLIAFELLLKAALRVNGLTPSRNHSYRELFASLPPGVQRRLRSAAATRMSTAASFSDLDGLLDTWSRNFIGLRYPYEKYEGLTGEQYHARGEAWLAKGAPEAKADFVYRPDELYGMVFALQQEIESWLKDQPNEGDGGSV